MMTAQNSEQVLIANASNGDLEAFNQLVLYQRHPTPGSGFCSSAVRAKLAITVCPPLSFLMEILHIYRQPVWEQFCVVHRYLSVHGVGCFQVSSTQNRQMGLATTTFR